VDILHISCVKYSNSLPFIYGLEHSAFKDSFKLSLDSPAQCYEKLARGAVDIGLIPAVGLNFLKNLQIVSPYCIGARNKVLSVILCGKTKLENISKIYLDYQSRTSVELIRILCRFHWKIDPEFIHANPGFEQKEPLPGEAFVVIGDRAFPYYSRGMVIKDLAEEWYNYSSKPFVFACWGSLKPVPEDMLSRFNKSLQSGLDNRSLLISKHKEQFSVHGIDLEKYFFSNINYDLDVSSREGLELFLNLLSKLNEQ